MTCQHCDKNFVCDVTGCALPIFCNCECHDINITGANDEVNTIIK